MSELSVVTRSVNQNGTIELIDIFLNRKKKVIYISKKMVYRRGRFAKRRSIYRWVPYKKTNHTRY